MELLILFCLPIPVFWEDSTYRKSHMVECNWTGLEQHQCYPVLLISDRAHLRVRTDLQTKAGNKWLNVWVLKSAAVSGIHKGFCVQRMQSTSSDQRCRLKLIIWMYIAELFSCCWSYQRWVLCSWCISVPAEWLKMRMGRTLLAPSVTQPFHGMLVVMWEYTQAGNLVCKRGCNMRSNAELWVSSAA